jgi:hypothetical protein
MVFRMTINKEEEAESYAISMLHTSPHHTSKKEYGHYMSTRMISHV